MGKNRKGLWSRHRNDTNTPRNVMVQRCDRDRLDVMKKK